MSAPPFLNSPFSCLTKITGYNMLDKDMKLIKYWGLIGGVS